MSTFHGSPTLSLLCSAFGPGSTPYTVLECHRSSTSAELRRAYRKAALRHHPDRCSDKQCDASSSSSSTAKFQAISAAYQILMDEGRRSVYDKTGRIVEEDDDFARDDGDDAGGEGRAAASSTKGRRGGARSSQQRQWEQFFHSVFDELISTGSKHASTAASYRGSAGEKEDVLYYYTMCKGDMSKVVDCILHGTAKDVARWKAEIVDPAVSSGKVARFGSNKFSDGRKTSKRRRTILEDSSSDEEITEAKSSSKMRSGRRKPKNNSVLVDTDDEEDECNNSSREEEYAPSTAGGGMSKRDKMDYRVAKKRRAKAEKEMKMADIIGSKDWGAGIAKRAHSGRPRTKNMGGIGDALLSNIEKKYNCKRKKRK